MPASDPASLRGVRAVRVALEDFGALGFALVLSLAAALNSERSGV